MKTTKKKTKKALTMKRLKLRKVFIIHNITKFMVLKETKAWFLLIWESLVIGFLKSQILGLDRVLLANSCNKKMVKVLLQMILCHKITSHLKKQLHVWIRVMWFHKAWAASKSLHCPKWKNKLAMKTKENIILQ
jgi:hypothetical protein